MKKESTMNGSWWDEDWWLEHLEGETETALKKDLEVLLKNSSADRQLLESWQKIKGLVKSADPVPMPEDGRVYDRLHNRIMAAFDQMNGSREDETSLEQVPDLTKDWRPTLVATRLSAARRWSLEDEST